MRVLISEPKRRESQAADHLEAAGHEVVRCHEEDGTFACVGLTDHACPLDQDIDVAVAVRPDAEEAEESSLQEMGVVCALRHHVPLVVAGAPGEFEPWATATTTVSDVAATVEAAAGSNLPEHATVARNEAARLLGEEAHPEARAHREGSRLLVTVAVQTPIDDQRRESLAVRVAGEVRKIDRYSGIVDVRVVTTEDDSGT